MSGYDKHPDYGGPPVAWWKVAALMIGFGAIYFFISFGHAGTSHQTGWQSLPTSNASEITPVRQIR
jgi:hypothetical protein